jgi:hypothetical protein
MAPLLEGGFQVPPLVENADDLYAIVIEPIAENIAMNENRSEARQQVVARSPQRGMLRCFLRCGGNITEYSVCNITGRDTEVVAPNLPQILFGC